MAEKCEMWPFAWECVIRTFSALGRFGDVKEVWVLGKTEVRDVSMLTDHRSPLDDLDFSGKICLV